MRAAVEQEIEWRECEDVLEKVDFFELVQNGSKSSIAHLHGFDLTPILIWNAEGNCDLAEKALLLHDHWVNVWGGCPS